MPASTRRKPVASSNKTARGELGEGLSVGEIVRAIERRAPATAAEDWDNVGLLAGDPAWRTRGAVVAIDLTERALEAALAERARLIVTHHPCIFPGGPRSRGLSRLVPGRGPALAATVLEAYRAGVAIASCHTNFDQCALEVVEAVSRGLGVAPKGRLVEDGGAGQLRKLVAFIPEGHVEKVSAALWDAGAGQIGDYDRCSFSARGEGTFRGGGDTRPFLGKPGRLERAKELRFETIYPRSLEPQILEALFASHPYEEVAYDIYTLEQRCASGKLKGLVRGFGYGFWGDLKAPKAFPEMTKDVKSLFNLDGFLLTEKRPESRIKRIAFVAGKGSSFVSAAVEAGCDLFITGEVGYHGALEASRRGMNVMEIGHRESERFFVETMKTWISDLKLRPVVADVPTQRFSATV